jgi:hypothetical protein
VSRVVRRASGRTSGCSRRGPRWWAARPSQLIRGVGQALAFCGFGEAGRSEGRRVTPPAGLQGLRRGASRRASAWSEQPSIGARVSSGVLQPSVDSKRERSMALQGQQLCSEHVLASQPLQWGRRRAPPRVDRGQLRGAVVSKIALRSLGLTWAYQGRAAVQQRIGADEVRAGSLGARPSQLNSVFYGRSSE